MSIAIAIARRTRGSARSRRCVLKMRSPKPLSRTRSMRVSGRSPYCARYVGSAKNDASTSWVRNCSIMAAESGMKRRSMAAMRGSPPKYVSLQTSRKRSPWSQETTRRSGPNRRRVECDSIEVVVARQKMAGQDLEVLIRRHEERQNRSVRLPIRPR